MTTVGTHSFIVLLKSWSGLETVNPLLAPESAMRETAAETPPEPPAVTAVYHIRGELSQVVRRAREIALEQTVEVPWSMAQADERVSRWVAQTEAPETIPGQCETYAVRISYDQQLTGGQLPQLLNLLYGNISLQQDIKLHDVELPEEFLARFRGPRYGIAGLRNWLGVYGRPLLATALKPVGISIAELANLTYEFAVGGGDLVKDDHNLHDTDFEAFRERVGRCQEAVQKANHKTGRRTLYLPNLITPAEEVERRITYCLSQGIRGVLVAPFLLGLDLVRSLADHYSLLVMAHPTFSGAYYLDPNHGMETGLLLGKILRLSGADISIFPNSGGRFPLTPANCQSIRRHLQEPLGNLAPAWPAPAGGMNFQNVPEMVRQYGMDSIFLMGGALLSHSSSLERSTREFLQRVEAHFPAQHQPDGEVVSACELPSQVTSPRVPLVHHLPHQPESGGWTNRNPVIYKASGELPFQDVIRHELLGKQGEQMAFDLRYFEIAPGGYSSLEKHAHTHAIICSTGTGKLLIDEVSYELHARDVAYVPPLAVHQLKNESTEPFGFFCIVDRHRDRPMAP